MSKLINIKLLRLLIFLAIMPLFCAAQNVQAAAIQETEVLAPDVVVGEKAVQCPTDVDASSAGNSSMVMSRNSSLDTASWFYENGLRGTYYDTFEPYGDSHIRLIQIDDDIQLNSQMSSPYDDPAIDPDTFSVKWSGYIRVPATGIYTFSTLSDDGVRLRVGCQNIIDRWGLVSLEYTNSTRIYLEKGWLYKFDMDYQEGPYNSTVFLFWKRGSQQQTLVPSDYFYIYRGDYTSPQHVNPIKGSGTGLKGEYFVGAQGVASGQTPACIVEGENIVHDWGVSSPDGLLPADDFSARWTGYLEAKYSDTYLFECASDDGIRVWIDDQLLLDKWQANSAEVFSLPAMQMTSGQLYKVKVEYNELGGGASCALYWSSKFRARDVNGLENEFTGQDREIIPAKYLYMSQP